MRQTTIKCDVCGIEKKESNHWWTVERISVETLCIRRFDIKIAASGTKDICGDTCVMKITQRFLATGILEERKE